MASRADMHHAVPAAAGTPDVTKSGVPTLVVQDLVRFYGRIRGVDGVSMECNTGQVHAVIGENGAGKSTLVKILSGAIQPAGGTVALDGRTLNLGSVAEARRNGIRTAFQELSLVPDWTVAENLTLDDRSVAGRFRPRRSWDLARAILARFGLNDIDPRVEVNHLPLARRHQVEIVRALASSPRVLILDESSSALGASEVEWLFSRIAEAITNQAAVLYISHRLTEISQIADSGTVLRDGRSVAAFRRGEFSQHDIVAMMAGREIEQIFPRKNFDHEARPGYAKPVVRVEALKTAMLDAIDLELRRGEILGVGGLIGHGQAELLKSLYGAIPAQARKWEVGDQEIRSMSPSLAVRTGIGFVPEDRKLDGVALDMSVAENLLAPWLKMNGIGGSALVNRNIGWLKGVLRRLAVKTAGLEVRAGKLSGGNQQKLVFGRWVDRNRSVLLLHDPTRGIDVGAKRDLYNVVHQLAQDGVSVLWFSTDLDELVEMCHRVIVLYRGRTAAELRGDQITAERILTAAIGVGAST